MTETRTEVEQLREIVALHDIRYEVRPHEDVVKLEDQAERVKNGFDLELHGTHDHGHTSLTSGCEHCAATYSDLRRIADIRTFSDASEEELVRLAAAVESNSEHPIAAGVLRTAEERGISVPEARDFEAITGKGVQAQVEGQTIRILSPGAIEREGLATSKHDATALASQGKTLAYVVRGDDVLGLLALADTLRPESKEAVEILHRQGITVIILTGDKKEVADWVAY